MTDPRQIELEEKRRKAMIIAQDAFDAAMQAPRRRYEKDIQPFKDVYQAAQMVEEAKRKSAFDAADEELAAGLRLLVAEQKASTELRCTHCGWVGPSGNLFQIAVGAETIAVCPTCRRVRATVEKMT